MNPRPSLREALHRADVAELDEKADALGREIGQAIAVALEEPPPERYKPNEEEERQRALDAALADAIEVVARHRARLGRRVCIQSDGKSVRLIFETLRAMPPDSSDQGFPS